MAKFQYTPDGMYQEKRIWFKCPGCKDHHILPIEGPKAWGFNHNLDRPTLTPSILYRADGFYDDEKDTWIVRPVVCHSFVTDGRIQFLGDCTHELKNQTIELPELETNKSPF